ncbi:MAG: stage II sporulation protein M [Oscillospiraceae bacterium]|jgi:stage II sporulation protein M|nr:stage II sporulation protein M [Oscillospiraceae bacterium]MCI2206186.1 stage II sporulation protein M [Oscillospiraceae bacterium]
MKAVISYNKNRINLSVISEALHKYHRLALWAVILLAGVICGALLSVKLDVSHLQKVGQLFASNYSSLTTETAGQKFASSISASFVFVFVCFLCGLSVWGAFFIPMVPFFRGIGIGITGGYLYLMRGMQGFLFYGLILLPGAFFSCLSVLFASNFSWSFSKRISSAGLFGKEAPPELLTYFQQFGIVLLLSIIGAALDTVLSVGFSGKFIFA